MDRCSFLVGFSLRGSDRDGGIADHNKVNREADEVKEWQIKKIKKSERKERESEGGSPNSV